MTTEEEIEVAEVDLKLSGYSLEKGVYSCGKEGIGITDLDSSGRCDKKKTATIYCWVWHYAVLTCTDHKGYFLEHESGAFKEV
jgi:hypothetical protein